MVLLTGMIHLRKKGETSLYRQEHRRIQNTPVRPDDGEDRDQLVTTTKLSMKSNHRSAGVILARGNRRTLLCHTESAWRITSDSEPRERERATTCNLRRSAAHWSNLKRMVATRSTLPTQASLTGERTGEQARSHCAGRIARKP